MAQRLRKSPVCFCDMDGVVADFVQGILDHHRRESPYTTSVGDEAWDLAGLLGLSDEEFWAEVDLDFWADLEPTTEAFWLVEYLLDAFGKDHFCFLTAPADTPGCIEGKAQWLRRWFPKLSDDVVFTKAKRHCAHSNAFLVDDRTSNVTSFIAFGGNACLLPRPWNSNHDLQVQTTVIDSVDAFLRSTRTAGLS